MIRKRSILSLIAGFSLIASWNYWNPRGFTLFGIKGVDWTGYPDIKVHAIFPITFFGGVILMALGIVLIKSDIEAAHRNGE
jgi:hypothetical protein